MMHLARRNDWLRQFVGLGLFVLVICRPVQAQDIPGYPSLDAYDRREVALLPRYCIYTQRFRISVQDGNDSDQIARWRAQMGDVFEHMHHYCWGMMKTNRAVLLTRSAEVRAAYLLDAVREYSYVIDRAPADFILLPEILTKKGENLVRLGKGPIGMLDFERAAELKPDYWPPYAHMSDYYRDSGEFDRAREIAEKGLSLAPEAVALKRRLAELDAAKSQAKSKRSN